MYNLIYSATAQNKRDSVRICKIENVYYIYFREAAKEHRCTIVSVKENIHEALTVADTKRFIFGRN